MSAAKSALQVFGSVVIALALAAPTTGQALAVLLPAKAPGVRAMSPSDRAIIHGMTATMHVAVSNFSLVPPSGRTNGTSAADTGHIEYVLDNFSNFKAKRDSTTALTHTWKHVPPGPHTLKAYLANPEYVVLPGIKPAKVSVTLVSPVIHRRTGAKPTPKPTRAPTARPTRVPTTVPRSTQTLRRGPTTGGAADLARPGLNLSLLIAGVLLLGLGILFFTGRRLSRDRPKEAGARAGLSSTGANEVEFPESQLEKPPESDTASPSSSAPPILPLEQDPELSTEPQQPLSEEAAANPLPVTSKAEAAMPPMPGAEPETSVTEPQAGGTSSPEEGAVRTQAIDLARQWTSAVEDLVHQLDKQEDERRELAGRVAHLEALLQANQGLRTVIEQAEVEKISDDELAAVEYITESLVRDPDHIVVLAGVSQNAEALRRVVANYVKVQQALQRAGLPEA